MAREVCGMCLEEGKGGYVLVCVGVWVWMDVCICSTAIHLVGLTAIHMYNKFIAQ